MKVKLKHILLTILLVIAATAVIDTIRISSYGEFSGKPEKGVNFQQDLIYADLVKGRHVDWSLLEPALEYINNQYDGSDYRMVNILRIVYEYGDIIPDSVMSEIENTILGFRYWWDEPGENSMCYWSENHQILFASDEFLAGQLFPDKVFKSGITGKEHMEKARKRALNWLKMRWNYGFTEFFSDAYYNEDVSAMINLIDFAGEEEIVKKTMIIMDLLFYDLASQSLNNFFISATGRAYERNRKGNYNSPMSELANYFWGTGKELKPGAMYGMMTTKKYSLPPVLKDIAGDSCSVVIKQSNGLDLDELNEEGYSGTDTQSMMMQWGMEAFSNPEIIRNSLANIRKNGMFSNEFLAGFKGMDFTLIRWLHIEPLMSRFLNPQTNGVAIQKGNTYTYKTNDYSIYTAQEYHPGTYGDQQHIAGMNVGSSFGVFHTHPAVEKDVKHKSPNYWVGYGHIPHVVQDSNVILTIYDIPERKVIMEMDLPDYTHSYFPKEKFDSVVVSGNYAMGIKGDTYCALIGANKLFYRENTTDDLIQRGKQSFWIIEAGSKKEDSSFDEFCRRVKENRLTFDSRKLMLMYDSGGKKYKLRYKGEFSVNGRDIDTNYDRFDSPYIRAKSKAETLAFKFNGKSLFLDFYNIERIMY